MPPPEESSAGQQAPTAPVLNFTSNLPVPKPMKVSGDRVTNWEFLRQQWEDYELGTGLELRPERPEPVCFLFSSATQSSEELIDEFVN